MVRHATYTRTVDEHGKRQHSFNLSDLSDLGVFFGFLLGFGSICGLAFGVLWAFAEPRVLAAVKTYSEDILVPRIERIEWDVELRDSALTKRLDGIASDLQYIRQRVDAAADSGKR